MIQVISKDDLDDVDFFYRKFIDAVKSNDSKKIVRAGDRLIANINEICRKN